MTSKTNFINYFLLAFTLAFISSGLSAGTLDFKDKKKDKEKKEELTADGPYVLYQPDGQIRVINVDKKGNIIDTTYTTLPQNFTLHVTDHKGRFPFDVKLHPVKRPGWNYPQADKVFVMSDPHGRLDCVISLLQGNHIIDKDYKWSFGKNHLMIIGDIFDRGKDVPQIFWLFYKLEEEAAKAGGHVSFILGNHEPMVLANDLRYTKEKYKILAEKLKMEYPRLFGPDTELGRWLGTRNTMQMIGNDLYVHAGLGKDFYDKNLSIPTVNEEMSKGLFMTKKERKALSPLTAFLYGEYLKSQKSDVKVVALEPAASPVLSEGKGGPHKIQGIGAGFVPDVLNTKIYDEIYKADNDEGFAAAKLLAKTEGILVGISSGAALSGAIAYAKKPENKGKTIVALLPDSGDRYYSTPLFTE